jgi:NAD(P)-dependent dehydrogenase (short-subunit alcohol dehydrogenase family)
LEKSIFSSAVQVKVRLHSIPLSIPADPFQALIGTVEELSASTQTQNLVRDQFETNYFGPLNIIKATLPDMRRERSGHVMIISGISKIYS